MATKQPVTCPDGAGARAFEHGRIGYAIGDVHGRADLLELMIARIGDEITPAGSPPPVAIFLGDYVDRGPDSAAVLQRLSGPLPAGVEWRFLKGNHEQAMLNFIDNPIAHRGWLAHGGLETLASYGVEPLPSIGSRRELIRSTRDRLVAVLPQAHLQFLRGLERWVVFGDYLFVHAGIDASRPLEQQKDEDLFWARAGGLDRRRRYSHLVVHGHTPMTAPHRDEQRICIDLGAYANGRLCAARFEGPSVRFMIEERLLVAADTIL